MALATARPSSCRDTQLVDGLGSDGLAGELDDVDSFRRLHDGRAALAPNPVAAEIQRNAIEPGRELRLALEAAQGAERTQKRLLRDIASFFLPPDHPVRQGINRPLPAQHQLVEAVQIAASRAGDQLFVTHHSCAVSCKRWLAPPPGRCQPSSPALRFRRRAPPFRPDPHFTFALQHLRMPRLAVRLDRPATHDLPAARTTRPRSARVGRPARVPGAGPDVLAGRHLDARPGRCHRRGARRSSTGISVRAASRSGCTTAGNGPSKSSPRPIRRTAIRRHGSRPAILMRPRRAASASTSRRFSASGRTGGRAGPQHAPARLAPRPRHARRRGCARERPQRPAAARSGRRSRAPALGRHRERPAA